MRAEGFRKELEHLINRESRENGSNTPDFLLADYLVDCLRAYDKTVNAREKWYGRPVNLLGDPRPAIAELEAILNSDEDTPITIHPDGSVTAERKS